MFFVLSAPWLVTNVENENATNNNKKTTTITAITRREEKDGNE
jgi:hypothetical protein